MPSQRVIPRNWRPSVRSGHARHGGESAHPELWRSLRVAVSPELGPTGALQNYGIGGTPLTLQSRNNGAWVKSGWDFGSNATKEDYWQGSVVTDDWSDQYISVVVSLTPVTLNAYQRMLDIGTSGDLSDISILIRNTGSTWTQQLEGTGHTVAAPNNSLSANSRATVGFTWNDATDAFERYQDGSHIGSDTLPATLTLGGTKDLILGARSDTVQFMQDGIIHVAYVWDRLLSGTEMRLVTRDPLAPFRLRSIAVAIPEAAPAGHSVHFMPLLGVA